MNGLHEPQLSVVRIFLELAVKMTLHMRRLCLKLESKARVPSCRGRVNKKNQCTLRQVLSCLKLSLNLEYFQEHVVIGICNYVLVWGRVVPGEASSVSPHWVLG